MTIIQKYVSQACTLSTRIALSKTNRKKVLYFIKTFTFFIITLVPSSAIAIKHQIDTTTCSEKTFTIQSSLSTDTLMNTNIETKISSAWYESSNMPWLIAVFISIISISLNLFISYKQMRANREITLQQIRATLSVNNRQDWISETRATISEFLTHVKLLNIEYQEKVPNEEKQKILQEKVSVNRFKLLLLLKSDKEKHKQLQDSIIVLLTTLDEHLLNSKPLKTENKDLYNNLKLHSEMEKVVHNGRDLLYDEWKKVQSIADKT